MAVRQANMQSALVGLVTGICPSLKQLAIAAVKMPLLLLDEIRKDDKSSGQPRRVAGSGEGEEFRGGGEY